MYGKVGENRAVAIESRRRHDDAHNVPDSLGAGLNLGEDAAPPQRGKQAKTDSDDAKTEALQSEAVPTGPPSLPEAVVPSLPGTMVQAGAPPVPLPEIANQLAAAMAKALPENELI